MRDPAPVPRPPPSNLPPQANPSALHLPPPLSLPQAGTNCSRVAPTAGGATAVPWARAALGAAAPCTARSTDAGIPAVASPKPPGVGAESRCQGMGALQGPAGGFTVSTGAAPSAPDPCPSSRRLEALSEGMEARPAIGPCGSGAPGLRRGSSRGSAPGRTATDGPVGSAKHKILVKEPKGSGTRPTHQALHSLAKHGGVWVVLRARSPPCSGICPIPSPPPQPHDPAQPHPAAPTCATRPAWPWARTKAAPGAGGCVSCWASPPPVQHGRCSPAAAHCTAPCGTARLCTARGWMARPSPVCLCDAWHGAAWHGTARHGLAWHIPMMHGTAQPGTAQPSMAHLRDARHSTARHSLAWHFSMMHGTVQPGTAQLGTAWHSTSP